MSDAQSLTLPSPTARVRVRWRKPKKPPLGVLFALTWDVAWTIIFVASGLALTPPGIAGVLLFTADARVQLRLWREQRHATFAETRSLFWLWLTVLTFNLAWMVIA